MKDFLKNKRFFNISLLILLTGYLIFPRFCLADNLEEITLEKIKNYLELPEKDAENILFTLKQVFTTDWINRESSGFSTEEECLVPLILRKAVTIQILNHLLVEAPVEITLGIIKGAVKMAKIFLLKDISDVIGEIEKQSVQKAIDYGINALLEKEVRITPGAMEFSYLSQKGNAEKTVFQYILIYRSLDNKNGKIDIKFYSPEYIEPPKSQGSIGSVKGIPHGVEDKLSPFIVEIDGTIEKTDLDIYKWVYGPFIKIDFLSEVPDLGIKPLNFWEKQILKPIESTIKDVEIIITKITGKSPKLVDIWEKVKQFISKIKSLSPAGLVETSTGGLENISNIINSQIGDLSSENLIKDEIVAIESEMEKEPEREVEKQLSLEEIQEILDDISEKVDIISQKVTELVVVSQPVSEKIKEKEDLKENSGEEDSEEEIILTTEEKSEIEQKLCPKISGETPLRNKVIFNEITWMGGINSANDEWIELKNISGTQIDLTGWQILDKEDQIMVILGVSRNLAIARFLDSQFLLLERTNDNSVSGITADLIYTGNINNTNESLYLFDENCQLQDEVEANSNWSAGDNNSKRTMERRADFSWQTSQNPGGTPKGENSSGYIVQPIEGGGGGGGGGSVSSPSQQTPAPSPTSSLSQILISEIQIETANSTDYDFIELYNSATNSTDISGFQLKKKSSTGNEYSIRVFPEGSSISAQNYFLWANSDYASFVQISADTTSSQTLAKNNSIVLLDDSDNIIDAVAWGTSTDPFIEGNSFPQNPVGNQSIGRKWSTGTQDYIDTNNNQNDFEIQSPTPKTQNQSPPPSLPENPSLSVVINEIAWMGTSATNSSNEWIELYNNTASTIDITGWRLVSAGGSPNIIFSTSSIAANSFYLLERIDDQTISDILADQIYTGALANDGEKLELRNANNTLIDLIDCSGGWFAGTTTLRYISMERIDSSVSGTDSTNWTDNNQITKNSLDIDGNPIYGTPKAENSVSKSQTEISGAVDYPILTYYGSPYVAIGTLIVPYENVLNVEPDVILKFNNGTGIEISGTLKAIGEENKKIVFTPSVEPNYWQGIYFNSSSTDSELTYTEIKYGKRGVGESPAILVENSSIILASSTIENYTDRGLKLVNSSSTIENTNFLGSGIAVSTVGIEIEGGSPTVKNCGLIKDNRNGIYMELFSENDLPIIERNNLEDNEKAIYTLDPNIFFKSNRGQNNQFDGILIVGGITKENLTWYKNDLPYIIYPWVSIGYEKKLTIEKGTTIQFDNGAYMNVDGTLISQGTDSESISFIAFPGQAPWRRIYFSASSTSSILENVIIQEGAGYGTMGQVYIEGSMVEFKNSTSSDSCEAGIYLENSSSTIQNSYFGDQQFGMKIYGSDRFPQLGEGISFENNSVFDIFIDNAANWCGAVPGYLATTSNNCP